MPLVWIIVIKKFTLIFYLTENNSSHFTNKKYFLIYFQTFIFFVLAINYAYAKPSPSPSPQFSYYAYPGATSYSAQYGLSSPYVSSAYVASPYSYSPYSYYNDYAYVL